MVDPIFKSPMTNYPRLRQVQSALPKLRAGNRGYWFQRLDDIGEDQVLNLIAEGNTHAEICFDITCPPIYFQEWIETRVDTKRLEAAMKMFASVQLTKANLALEYQTQNPAEAKQQQTHVEHFRWAASMADPSRWTPPKQTQAPPPSVNITFDMGGDAPKASLSVGTPKKLERPADRMLQVGTLTMDMGDEEA